MRPPPTIALAIVLGTLALGRPAAASCTPVTPVACPNCFAVFVMPDTQNYVAAHTQPGGANHLDLVSRYICDNRTSWTEPGTGKQMPILMSLHLGDLVEHGDGSTSNPNTGEWAMVDAAFDKLDACTPSVPYLVTIGNHDLRQKKYGSESDLYQSHFGVDRWTSQGYGCSSPGSCDWDAGEWFIGGGDPIEVNSRNHINQPFEELIPPPISGPATLQAGRHRAGRIKAPNGQPFLFMGLELAFDYPPATPGFEGSEADDSAWPIQIMNQYQGTATIVFHHSMLWVFPPPDTRLRWGPEIWESDSIPAPEGPFEDPDFGLSDGMEKVYQRLVEPFPQAMFLFTGHVVFPTNQANYTIERTGEPPVHAFLRNYQSVNLAAQPNSNYGVGWNVVAVFDPDAEEVRVRSYRIDDQEAYADPPVNYDHLGTPAATECFDTDQAGAGERVISWDFEVPGRPAPTLPPTAAGALSALLFAGALRVIGVRR